jgi:phosphoribosylglycinamide formyltransferase-1
MINQSSRCRVVVLIGGNGSNLQALIDKQSPSFDIVGVISHRAEAYGLERAKKANIPTTVIAHQDYANRNDFETALLQAVNAFQPDLIVLAGFMRILSPAFIHHYRYNILNIHPSLLPQYKGLHTHQRVLDANETEHGATVHFVTPDLDEGPIVAHMKIDIATEDTVTSLANRVHQLEHILYPTVVEWFAESRLKYKVEGVKLDGQPLGSRGCVLTLTHTEET